MFLFSSAGPILEKQIGLKVGFLEGEEDVVGLATSTSPSLGRIKKFGFVLYREDPGTVQMEIFPSMMFSVVGPLRLSAVRLVPTQLPDSHLPQVRFSCFSSGPKEL